MKFKKGDIVKHKLTGQKMVVKKLHGSVLTLEKEIPEPYTFRGIVYPGDIAICHEDNLEMLKD